MTIYHISQLIRYILEQTFFVMICLIEEYFVYGIYCTPVQMDGNGMHMSQCLTYRKHNMISCSFIGNSQKVIYQPWFVYMFRVAQSLHVIHVI